jgi:hypothetical protein
VAAAWISARSRGQAIAAAGERELVHQPVWDVPRQTVEVPPEPATTGSAAMSRPRGDIGEQARERARALDQQLADVRAARAELGERGEDRHTGRGQHSRGQRPVGMLALLLCCRDGVPSRGG